MSENKQLNVRIDEVLLGKLKKSVAEFNEKHKVKLTVSGMVKSILEKWLDGEKK
jgi:hypothetical protein